MANEQNRTIALATLLPPPDDPSGARRSLSKRSGALQEKTPPATKLQIAEIVVYTETLKQIKPPLTDQQRKVLVDELFVLGETREQIEKRARSVVLRETFGTIAFSYWIDDLVCLRTEARRLANELVEKRKAELQSLGWSEEELWRAGLEEVAKVSEIVRGRLVEQYRKKAETAVRKLSARVKLLDDDSKTVLWRRVCDSLSIDKKDPHWREVLPHLVPRAFDLVDAFFRELDERGSR